MPDNHTKQKNSTLFCLKPLLSGDRLGPFSEMLAISTYKNTKNIIITALDLRGPMDVHAFEAAVTRGAADNPQMVTRLKKQTKGLARYLARERDPHLRIPLKVVDAAEEHSAENRFDTYIRVFTPEFDEPWDLFNEAPVRILCVRFGQSHSLVGIVYHHSIADAAKASEFSRELFANYHELLTGEVPPWRLTPSTMSTNRKRMVKLRRHEGEHYLKDAAQAIRDMRERFTLPTGSGRPGDTSRHHVKKTLTVEQTERLTQFLLQRNVSLMDFLVTGSNLIIDEWNSERGIAPGLLSTTVTVNMTGRYEGFGRLNNSGLIIFKSAPQERKNIEAFRRSVALDRIRQFRNQMDFKFYRDVFRLVTLLRPAPFRLKRKISHFVLNRHKYSMSITLLGVMWPEVKSGDLAGSGALTTIGHHDVLDVIGVGYKLLSETPLLLINYFFNKTTSFVLIAAGHTFTEEETRAFLHLLIERLCKDAEIA